MHLLIEEFQMHTTVKAPKILAKNSERFRTLTLGRFIIQDSLEHMPASLDALVKDLNQTKNFTFPIVRQMRRFKNLNWRRKKKGLTMLTRKGIFCYEHYTSFQQIKSATSIPPPDAFYSTLNEESISQSDYKFAKDMYKYFKCKNMLDYMMLYCSLDVALLCETFLQYRKMVMKHFDLDPAYYVGNMYVFIYHLYVFIKIFIFAGIPGLSFDIMLKSFAEEEGQEGYLELFSDPSMEHFFTKGIRGGQSFISQRYAEGEMNPKNPGKHLLYIDGMKYILSYKLASFF